MKNNQESNTYWDLLNKEKSIIKNSYENNTEIFDFVISSWELFTVDNYFKSFSDQAALILMYKTQADVALMRAITSILKKEYSQAIYNIRYALENISITIFAYSQPDTLVEIIGSVDRNRHDEKIKKAANKYLATDLAIRSSRLKNLHKMCDRFGSHQSMSHHSSNFIIDQKTKKFHILLQGSDSQEMNVGLTGIIVGLILEFHFAVSEIGEVEHVKVRDECNIKMKEVENKLDKMKAKNIHLFLKLL